MTDLALDGVEGPHADQPVVTEGADLDDARAAVVMVHGRGATARSILGMADEFGTDHVAYLAPSAARNTWYPQSFLAETDENEPHLSSALSFVGRLVDRAADAVGYDRVALLGFSQGACLASEWAARNARRYGGVIAFSGGLIGPPGTPREYDGDLDGTPAFVGCSDSDPHIPLERVHETAEVLEAIGAEVDERIYEGMGHGINEEELAAAKGVVTSLERERA
ncbi:alpha/beta hydrolase [Candidatus Halobonum tyrrellensis]|uniref:Putative esterase n=1 Tax=Candidatus Halobonum tyrrellensis G22 TaxID=1324957 RepID=V4HKI9_9EURY|nr:dienelactone hydrolase family protein [Candidatus Halobonum tyrrellensis]ESP88434.1 putative esterase [Candidatus Halobonum tyrrellensis G22]